MKNNDITVIVVSENCHHCAALKRDPDVQKAVKEGKAIITDITKNEFLFSKIEELGLNGVPSMLSASDIDGEATLCNTDDESGSDGECLTIPNMSLQELLNELRKSI